VVNCYPVAVCYATAVILLGWYPWNFLLILLLFSNKYLQLSGIGNAGESGRQQSGGSCP
jgi:hypothetical protein